MQIVDIEHADASAETALALGYFDTFHIGHRKLLAAVCESGYSPAMFTFEGDFYGALGLEVLPIYTQRERMRLAEELGVRYVFTLPADQAHMRLSADAFLRLLLRANPRLIVCGEDFRFGYHAAAGVEELRAFCLANGIECSVFPLLKDAHGEKIGSVGIRDALMRGDMHTVEASLGRAYTLEGVVVHGRADGAKMGIPTANFPLDAHRQPPRTGVYVCGAKVREKWYLSVCNIGAHPTVGDMRINVECYLLHYTGDLYNLPICVRLHERIRDTRKFDTKEALVRQIRSDCLFAERTMGDIYD